MDGVRLANMFYDQRGPLVFSASVHLVLLVVVAIWALVTPEKEPEEFVFDLVPPPASGSFETPTENATMEEVRYEKSEDQPLPTLDEIEIPERPPRVVEIEMPEPEPEPEVVETVEEQPLVEQPVVEQPKPKPMSYEEYLAQNPDADKIKNVDKRPVQRKPAAQIDLSRLKKLDVTIGNLPSTEIAAYTTADVSAVNAYVASFKVALKRAIESHPQAANQLSVRIECDIAANGRVTNVRIVQGSGDPVFDRKVVEAYRRVGIFQPPPKGRALIQLGIWFDQ